MIALYADNDDDDCIVFREVFKNPSNGNFPLRGGGVPPFSVNFFPLTFSPAVVR